MRSPRTIDAPSQRSRRGALRCWAARIGAISAGLLGLVHVVLNTAAYLGLSERPVQLLVPILAPTAAAWAIAAAAWRYSNRNDQAPAIRLRVIVAIGGALLTAFLVRLLLTDPEVLADPFGPGVWTAIGGPALLIAAITGRATAPRSNRPRSTSSTSQSSAAARAVEREQP